MAFQKQGIEGYNKVAEFQLKMNLGISSILTDYILQALPLSSHVFNIIDYGSSEGFNSMSVYSKALSTLRENSSKPVHILHNDLPSNNWTVFFNTINDSPSSYLKLENVFYSSIGRSFYNQLCPSNSIHFGYAGICFHFMSKKPECDRVEHRPIYPEAINQMIQDLKTNLEYRLKELVTGGIFCMLVLSREDDNILPSEEIVGNMLERVYRRGVICEEEFNRFRYCFCGLKREYWEEILRFFEGRFEVLEFEKTVGPFPAYEQYVSDGNREAYFGKLKAMFLVSIKLLLFDMLEKRSAEERDGIIKECVDEIINLIPEPIGIPFIMQFIALRKIKD
jgi:salicylate 1-O-methyltransferase